MRDAPNYERLDTIMEYLCSKRLKYFSYKRYCYLFGSIEIVFRAPRLEKSHIHNYRLLIACPIDLDTNKYFCETCRIQKDGSLIGYKKEYNDHKLESMEDLMIEIKRFYYRFICLPTIHYEVMLRSVRKHKRPIPKLTNLCRLCLYTDELEYIRSSLLELPN